MGARRERSMIIFFTSIAFQSLQEQHESHISYAYFRSLTIKDILEAFLETEFDLSYT